MKKVCLGCGEIYNLQMISVQSQYEDEDGTISIHVACPKAGCEGSVVEIDDNMIGVVLELKKMGFVVLYASGGSVSQDKVRMGIRFEDNTFLNKIKSFKESSKFEMNYKEHTIECSLDKCFVNSLVEKQKWINVMNTTLCEFVSKLKFKIKNDDHLVNLKEWIKFEDGDK